ANESAQAVPILKEFLLHPASTDPAKVQCLISELDSDRSVVRKQASSELEKIGQPAAPLLRKALEADPSPELHRPIDTLLSNIAGIGPRGEWLRGMRAIEVLEWISTLESKEALQSVAKKAPNTFVKRAAQAALKRLDK